MKKLITLLLILALTTPFVMAQKGLSLGANFMTLSSSIVNQNTWGNGHEYDYALTFNSSFGFDAGYNFTEQIGLYTGYWFTNFGQKYTDSYNDSDFTRKLKYKYSVIPVMLRFSSSENTVNFLGGVGVLIASMRQADQEWLKDGEAYTQTGETIGGIPFNIPADDVTARYNKTDIVVNIELGARIIVIDNLYIDASLNFGYGVKDINAPEYQIPDTEGTYNSSHNAYGGFKVGVAYILFGE
jgi:hypothetical protein